MGDHVAFKEVTDQHSQKLGDNNLAGTGSDILKQAYLEKKGVSLDEAGRPTEFKIGDHNTRTIRYDSNGDISEIDMQLPGARCQGMKLTTSDGGQTYQMSQLMNGKWQDFAGTYADLRVNPDSGTISFNRTDGFPDQRNTISRNGDEHWAWNYDGVHRELVFHPDRSETAIDWFPNARATVDKTPDGAIQRMEFKSIDGSSVTFTRTAGKDVFKVSAIDPSGHENVDHQTIMDPEKFYESLTSGTDVKVVWKTDASGVEHVGIVPQ